MDEEAKQLLREIRDIGLRNAAYIKSDNAARKRIMLAVLAFLVFAFCAIGYLFHVLDSMVSRVDDSQPTATDRH